MINVPTPLSEPPWLCGHLSPYYDESHRKWQRFCREFISKELNENAQKWDAEGQNSCRGVVYQKSLKVASSSDAKL